MFFSTRYYVYWLKVLAVVEGFLNILKNVFKILGEKNTSAPDLPLVLFVSEVLIILIRKMWMNMNKVEN